MHLQTYLNRPIKKNTFLVCYILFIVCMHLDLRLTYTK
jgi:hypothetical protein